MEVAISPEVGAAINPQAYAGGRVAGYGVASIERRVRASIAPADRQRRPRLFATFRATNPDLVREPEPVVAWQRLADRGAPIGLADSVVGIAERATTSLGSVGELSSRMIRRDTAASAWEKSLLAEDLVALGFSIDELSRVAVALRRALGGDPRTNAGAPAPAIAPNSQTTGRRTVTEGLPMA